VTPAVSGVGGTWEKTTPSGNKSPALRADMVLVDSGWEVCACVCVLWVASGWLTWHGQTWETLWRDVEEW